MLVQTEHYQEGLPYLQKASGLIPDSWAIYFYMGKAQLLLGHTETALPFLKQATNLNPDDSGAYYLLARAYKAQGLQQEAAAAMERVQALHNSSLDAERRALKDAGIVKNAGVESGRPN
jgi:predicted Zn-dependent protease